MNIVIGEFFTVLMALILGLLLWSMIATLGVGVFASPFGHRAQIVAIWAWLLLYIFVASGAFRRWNEIRNVTSLSSKERQKYLGSSWSLPLGLASALAIAASIYIFGWQILYWLGTDQWVPLDLVTLSTPRFGPPPGPMILFWSGNGPSGTDWLVAPTDWYGLHRIIHFVASWVSPPLILFIGGIGLGNVGSKMSEARHDMQRQFADAKRRASADLHESS